MILAEMSAEELFFLLPLGWSVFCLNKCPYKDLGSGIQEHQNHQIGLTPLNPSQPPANPLHFQRLCNIESNPIQFNPIQSNPIQSDPIRSDPIRSDWIGLDWIYLSIIRIRTICERLTHYFTPKHKFVRVIILTLKW